MTQQAPQRNLGRLSEIAQVAARHGFGFFFENRRFRRAELNGDPTQRGAHLRAMLDELGPTFVKFGQLLSMRPDILPPDIIAELRGLQDDVRPFPYEEARQVIEADLGLSLERLFLDFEEEPMAAASIGQVHRATLPNGRRVAVKVQRPDAPRQVEADIALLYQAAKLAKERIRRLDFIDARGIVDEFSRSIRQELDYRTEARNADTFRRHFAGHPRVRIPRVYWGYTRARVLTLEFIDGVQLARHRRNAVRRPGATPPRRDHHRDVDDDGLPQRLLPRRPASGEHPRAGGSRSRSAWSTSGSRASSATRT